MCVCVSGSPAGIGITKPDVEPEEKRGRGRSCALSSSCPLSLKSCLSFSELLRPGVWRTPTDTAVCVWCVQVSLTVNALQGREKTRNKAVYVCLKMCASISSQTCQQGVTYD